VAPGVLENCSKRRWCGPVQLGTQEANRNMSPRPQRHHARCRPENEAWEVLGGVMERLLRDCCKLGY